MKYYTDCLRALDESVSPYYEIVSISTKIVFQYLHYMHVNMLTFRHVLYWNVCKNLLLEVLLVCHCTQHKLMEVAPRAICRVALDFYCCLL